MGRYMAVLTVLILLGTTVAMAQNEENTQPMESVQTEVNAPLVESVQAEASALPEQSVLTEDLAEGNVSLDFRDADIRNVLQILSLRSGVNIVTAPEVTGLISIQLKDVPWKQALDVILQTYGYAYETKGQIIIVTTVETLKKQREDAILLAEQEALMTEIYPINFGKASEIIESIEKIKSERGSVNFDERTNTLIISDISSKQELIANVIRSLDRTTPQVLIDSKILETIVDGSEKLGIDWVVKATASGSARPTIYPFDNETDSRFAPHPFPSTTAGFTYGTLNFSSAQAVFELLESDTDTNILSNPKIVTLDNTPAIINVGVEHPIPTFGVNEETGELQTTALQYRNIGINFEVTPHVNNAGFVTLDVSPEVSNADQGSVTFSTITVPLIGVNKATTRVMVRNGDTLVIGGLMKDKNTNTVRKIPFVGDIPVLGLAFRKTEKTVAKTDLLIFITPHIITPVLESTP